MGEIHAQIAKLQGLIGAVEKSRKNTQQGYKFRGIADIYAAVHPHLAALGLFSVPEVLEITREERQSKSGGMLVGTIMKVRYTVYASDGSSVSGIVSGEGMDSGDKSANKALAGAHKYWWIQLLALPEEEPPDSEVDSPEPASPPIRKPPNPEPKFDARKPKLEEIRSILASIHDVDGEHLFEQDEGKAIWEARKGWPTEALQGIVEQLREARNARAAGAPKPGQNNFTPLTPGELLTEVF